MENIIKKNLERSTFKTSDLYLAAYLRAKSVRLLTYNNDGKVVNFIFESIPSVTDSLVQSYWNDAEVGVSSYVKALYDLKNIIFRTYKNNT